MPHDLGPNLPRPQQQVGECVANFIFGKFGYLGDLFLRVSATANRLADAIRRRELSQHERNASRREGRFVIERYARMIGGVAMFASGLLVFAQGLPAQRDLLSNAALAIQVQSVFARAADPEFGEWQGLFASRASLQFNLGKFCQ